MEIIQCGWCQNNIRLNIVHFSGGINDRGGIIVECEKCKKNSFYRCENPSESNVVLGGHKIEFWDNEIQSKDEFLRDCNEVKEAVNSLKIVGEIPKRSFNFNYNKPHIHFCGKCGLEIETLAHDNFALKKALIEKEFKNMMNYILANRVRNMDDLYIKTKNICNCGQCLTFVYHTKFKPNGNLTPNYSELSFIDTSDSIISENIDGVSSKSDCVSVLEKFLLRWSGLMNKIIIATPFVGHQWMQDDELIELWDWMKNYSDQSKTALITRTATINKYKKVCKEKGVDIDFLSFYGINDRLIEEMTKKQDFHAKIYIGANDKFAEVLSGSFNLLRGNSVENISFSRMSIEKAVNRFIEPMNIGLSVDDFKTSQRNALLIQENDDGFSSTLTDFGQTPTS
jgi:hypothetical protein